MAETATATPPTQADPKQTAANISKAVQDKAAGKSSAKGPDRPDDADQKGSPKAGAVDPNAGKKKYTIHGKDYWLTPEQADAYVQKGIAFEPRISEIARMKQELERFEQAMLNDPGRILANLAARAKVPVQNLVEKVLSSNASDEVKEATGKWYWENVAKRHKMDPKDLQILEQDEKIKKLEAADKAKADAAIATENRQRVVKALADISGQIKDTLAELGVKNADGALAIRLTKEIADVMRVSYFSRQPCTAKQAADKIRQRVQAYQQQFYDELDGEQLADRLGKGNVEKIRKHLLKVVQDAEKGTRQEATASGKPARRDERKTINMDEFHDMLDEMKRTGKAK